MTQVYLFATLSSAVQESKHFRRYLELGCMHYPNFVACCLCSATVKCLKMQKDVVLKKVLSVTVLRKNVSPLSISILMTKTTYLSSDVEWWWQPDSWRCDNGRQFLSDVMMKTTYLSAMCWCYVKDNLPLSNVSMSWQKQPTSHDLKKKYWLLIFFFLSFFWLFIPNFRHFM